MIGLFWGSLAGLGMLLVMSPDSRRSVIHWRDWLVAFAAGFIVLLLRVPVLALISSATVLLLFAQRRRAELHRRYLVRTQSWPDAIDFLLSSIRAGMSINHALIALQEQGPAVLRPVLLPMRQALLGGATVYEGLQLLKAHARDPVVDRLVLILEIAQHVGGSSLGTILRSLSHYVRAESRTRSELVARQSWTINAARLAVAAPWAIVALLSLRTHEAYATAAGTWLLIVGAAATCIGYLWMKRAGELPLAARLA